MNVKYANKTILSRLNEKAIRSNGNAIREEVVPDLSPRLRYPITPLPIDIPMPMGWTRCWVSLGPTEAEVVFLDIEDKELANLPTIEVENDEN